MQDALSKLGREAARIVLPAWCVACGGELPWRDRVASCCRGCWDALPRIASAKCVSCALPLPSGAAADPAADGSRHRAGGGPTGIRCITCSVDPLPLAWCDAWGDYRGSLERVLHAFKFERHDFLADPLAELLVPLIDDEFDAIVPVPMTKAKERRRGYNQAELLARALAKRVGGTCELLLAKTVEREPQSTLPRDARAKNVRGAFAAAARAKGRSILIVDDICTTGETLRACANELARAGAARVCAIAVAKAS